MLLEHDTVTLQHKVGCDVSKYLNKNQHLKTNTYICAKCLVRQIFSIIEKWKNVKDVCHFDRFKHGNKHQNLK